MIRPALLAASLVLSSISAAFADEPSKLELKDGDRIVYLGNTFAERDQSYGYLETLLTIRHPDINFTFRNLGWSGDTVWGDARARFGTRAEGFKHLKDHVLALKPTVILVAYGMNESFAGEAGLPEFEKGLSTLLDTLAETKARIVLISPIPQETMPPPLPDPTRHNRELEIYSGAIGRAAASRGLVFVDLFEKINNPVPGSIREGRPEGLLYRGLTDDGIHPTDRGYFVIDNLILFQLAVRRDHAFWLGLNISDDGTAKGRGVVHSEKTDRGVRVDVEPNALPAISSPGPDGKRGGGISLSVQGLPQGDYRVLLDGDEVGRFRAAPGAQAYGAIIQKGPDVDRVDKLRALINRKNELYFHRWRPQNETYLFGFRKHEQGNNAVEIPQFDPLVAELEAEIARLKKPVKHRYEIIREEQGK